MKTLIKLLLIALFCNQAVAQKKEIVTRSVTVDNLIPFIVEEYASVDSNQNITLLIETKNRVFDLEESLLLKQAAKYLSERLTKDDYISIVAYSKFSGVALEQTSANNIKRILNVLNDFEKHVVVKQTDGITLAYSYAEDNYREEAANTVIMIRNPNASKSVSPSSLSNTIDKPNKNQKSNVVLLTAIAVLPELISILKN